MQTKNIIKIPDLVDKVLSELGGTFFVKITKEGTHPDEWLGLRRIYSIRKLGLLGSRNWLLGSRTVLKLSGEYLDLQRFNREEDKLTQYMIIRDDYLNENVRGILKERSLDEMKY